MTTTQTAAALITLASAVVIAFALQRKSKRSMPAMGETTGEGSSPDLPPDFVVGSFVNSRSQSLFTVRVPRRGGTSSSSSSSTPARAMLVLAHGVGEHCIRPGYVALYESLSESGVDVYALDHHGHGRSDGMPRGYAERFDHYVEDLIEYVGRCRSGYGDCKSPPPLILMGQSMGGLIAVMTALRLGNDEVSGMVLTAPALGVDMSVVLRIQKLFAPIIDAMAPTARIVDAVRPVDMSRNADAVKAYVDDSYVQKGKLVARTCIGMDRTFDVVRDRRDELRCPLLILHGTSDVVTSMRSSLDFYHNVRSMNKRYLRLRGWYHEIYEDDSTGRLFGYIVKFVSSGGNEFENIDGKEEDEGGVIDVEF